MVASNMAVTRREPVYAAQQGKRGRNTTNVGPIERGVSIAIGSALALFGLTRRSPLGMSGTLAGGYLVYRGVTARCPVYRALGISRTSQSERAGVVVDWSVTINRPLEDVYRFWRNFAHLPSFMQHLESVTTSGNRQSHWVAKGPAGTQFAWDAEITEERENQIIAWRSLPDAAVYNAGTVRFSPATGGRGTTVHVTLVYRPPAGSIGTAVAKLFGEEPTQQVREDLRHFKELMEAGEIPTIQGQPSGRSK
jgi:uncharacterized membrane protein